MYCIYYSNLYFIKYLSIKIKIRVCKGTSPDKIPNQNIIFCTVFIGNYKIISFTLSRISHCFLKQNIISIGL